VDGLTKFEAHALECIKL